MKTFNAIPHQSGEQETNNQEKDFTNTEFEPWDENKQKLPENQNGEQVTEEDARKAVLESLGKKPGQKMYIGSESIGDRKINTELVIDNMNEEKQQLLNEVPDDKTKLDAWIDEINNLPEKYSSSLATEINENFNEQDMQNLDYIQNLSKKTNYDVSSYIALNKKHSKDMTSDTRDKSYSLLKNHFNEKQDNIGSDRVLDQIRRNIVALEDFPSQDSGKSKIIEKQALETFEQIAIDGEPELTALEKKKALDNLQKTLNHLNHYDQLLSQAKSPRERAKISQQISDYMKISNPSRSQISNAISRLEELKDDEDELFAQEKQRKFLYKQAMKERNRVSGFMNNRKLKQPENFLPDSYEEIQKNPSAYSANDLRNLALKYVEMQ